MREFSPHRLTAAIVVGIMFVFGLVSMGKIFEDIPANQYVVIQAPFTGHLTWYKSPQTAWQGFGEVTGYLQRSTYEFLQTGIDPKNGEPTGGIQLRFNDGGHAWMFGSIQFELPSDDDALTAIYTKFKDEDRIKQDLIVATVAKSVYLTGPLMSSKESYAEKRNDLLFYIMDQSQNGVYRTRQTVTWVKDPVTGQEKQVTVAEIVMDKDGKPLREEDSILNRYHIRLSNLAIVKMPYDKVVEDQIRQQQQLAMDVQTSIAELKKAEQRAMTVEQQGRADATQAKWQQEVEKAKAVTLAEQQKSVAITNAERDRQAAIIQAEKDKAVAETQATQRMNVADLDRKAAEQKKAELILLGEGQAQQRQLILAADGALAQKLDAWKEVNSYYANAMRGSNWVPSVVMAGTSGTSASNSGAADLIGLLTAKTAKDLALDMSMRGTTVPQH